MRPPRRPTPDISLRFQVFVIVLAVTVIAGSVAAGPTLTVAPLEPVSGDVARAGPNDWVTVESHSLNLTGGTANSTLVTVTNFDGSTVSGRISARLLTLNGRPVSAGNLTVSIQPNGASARCSIGLDPSRTPSSFAIVLVKLNTTVDVARRDADCASRGQS